MEPGAGGSQAPPPLPRTELAGAGVAGARDGVAWQPLGTAPAGASPRGWSRCPAAEPERGSARWDPAGASGRTQVPWQGEQQPLRPGWRQPCRGERGRAGSPWTRPSPASEGGGSLRRGSGPAQSSAGLAWGGSCTAPPPILQQNPASPTAPPPRHSSTAARRDPQRSPDTINTSQRHPSAFPVLPAGLEGDLASAAPSSHFLPHTSPRSPEPDRQSISERRAGKNNHNNSDSSWQGKEDCCSLQQNNEKRGLMPVSDILRAVIPQPAARPNPRRTDSLRWHRQLHAASPTGWLWVATGCQPGGCQLGAAPAGCRQCRESDAHPRQAGSGAMPPSPGTDLPSRARPGPGAGRKPCVLRWWSQR